MLRDLLAAALCCAEESSILVFRLNVSLLLMLTVLVPPTLFAITYVLSALHGHVTWCLPLLHGCTDITHTALYPPASYLFTFLLMPAATSMALLFYCFCLRLESLGGDAARLQLISSLGVTACVFLLASTALIQGKEYTAWHLHTICANSFFVLMLIAQFMYSRLNWGLRHRDKLRAVYLRCALHGAQILVLSAYLGTKLFWPIFYNKSYQWWLTLSIIAWYATFLLVRSDSLSLGRFGNGVPPSSQSS